MKEIIFVTISTQIYIIFFVPTEFCSLIIIYIFFLYKLLYWFQQMVSILGRVIKPYVILGPQKILYRGAVKNIE